MKLRYMRREQQGRLITVEAVVRELKRRGFRLPGIYKRPCVERTFVLESPLKNK